MAKQQQYVFLLLSFLNVAAVSVHGTFSPLPNSAAATASSLTTTPQQNDQQMNHIIDSLIGSGDFNSLENIISAAGDPNSALANLPISATFFIPSNDFHFPLDPFTLPYHTVPQRLTFSDLLLLKPHSRLPTLLPAKTIIVTNNSVSNFTLDDSLVFYPDLYLSSNIAVHGVQSLLDYSVYGGNSPPPPSLYPELPTPSWNVSDEGGGRMSSDAAPCLCREFSVIFLLVFGAVAFKIPGSRRTLWSLLED